MSRFQRTILLFGALIIVALLGAAVVVSRPSVQSSIHKGIEEALSNSFEGRVHLGSLETRLLPPSAIATDIKVYRHPGDTSPWLSANSATIKLSPWLSLGGNLIARVITLRGLSGVIDLQDPIFSSSASRRGPPPIEIGSVLLDGFNLNVLQNQSSLSLGEFHGTIDPRKDSHLAHLTITQSELFHREEVYPVSTRARAKIYGRLLSPDSIEVLPTETLFNSIKTTCRGQVGPGPAPVLDLRVEVDGTLDLIRHLHPRLEEWDGHVLGSLGLSGHLENPALSFVGSADDLYFKKNRLPDLQLHARYENSLITVDELKLHSSEHGTLLLSGTTSLNGDLETQFQARLTEVVLEQTLESLGLSHSWIRSPVSGTLAGNATLSPFKVDGSATLKFHHFQSLLGSYQNPQSRTLLHLPQTRVSARFQINPTRISLSEARIKRGTTDISLHGSFFLNPTKGMQVNVSSPRFNLEDLGLISGVPFEGRGSIAATVEGPYKDPTISATAELAGFKIRDYLLGTTKATLIYSDVVLDVPRVVIERGDGSAEGRITLNFRKKGIPTGGMLDLTRVPAGPLLDMLVLDTTSSRRFDGLVNGRLVVEGTLLHPTGIARLKSPRLRIDHSDLGAAQMVCRFGEPDRILTINLNLKPGEGTISSFYALLPKGQMTLKTAFTQVPIEVLTPMMGNIPVTGQLSGTSQHNGPPSALNGKLNFSATHLRAFGLSLETTTLKGEARDGTTRLEGSALSGDANIKGKLVLGSKFPFTATINFNDLDINRTGLVPEGMQATSTGSVFSQGSLLKAKDIMANTTLTKLAVKVNQRVLQASLPVRILYANQGFDFQDVQLSGDEMAFNVKGRASFTAPLNVQVLSNGPLQSLNGVLSKVEFTRGQFNLSLTLGGKWGAPTYTGLFVAEDGAVEISQTRVSNIDTQVSFQGDTILIESGHARIGDGVTRFGGSILLTPQKPAQVDINATLDKLHLTPLRDLETTLTGTLNLLGKSDDLTLRGDIELASLRYTANLDLPQLIRKRETPLRVPAFSPGKSWRLHININADDNLLVANNLLEAEFKAGLRVTGTTDHIGLVGSVTPLWATATYSGNSYKIDRAILDFTDEYRIFSQFDVIASTEACGMDLRVSITGDSEQYIVEASGKDEDGVVDSQDALLCAQFGVRLQDYGKEEGSGLRSTLPGAMDTLWKVSGMDERVRRFLPVVDQLRLTSGYSKSSARIEPRVLLSKALGKDWELKYNGPLYYKDEQHVISLEYRLSPTTTLESTWVSVSEASIGDLGLDLRLQWEFE